MATTEMIQLRPDQQTLKDSIYTGWSSGHTNMLGVLPTGGGKSVVVSDIVLDRHNAGARQCIMAHRNELVGQMSLHVARRGIKHRIIGSKSTIAQVIQEHRTEFDGRSFVNPDAACSVASVQTINARTDELKQWGAQIDDWTLDESHHLLRENLWGRAIKIFTNARGLGVTACPQRADGAGLGRHADGLFDDMVVGPSMRWLIDNKALSEYEIVCPTSDLDMEDDDISGGGDYSPQKMREKAKRSHIVGDVVQEYVKWAYGKRTIVFATDIETSNDIASRFSSLGIPAASVSSKTPAATRNEYIKRFRDGRLWLLINVDLFDEGFDVPACECVIMARPTASLNKYLQMIGRGLRVFAGKIIGLIIDMVSNWKRHGFPDRVWPWTLDRREKRAKRAPDPDDIPLTSCRECSRPYERALPACPYCGAVPEVGPARTLEQVDGDLVLLDRDTLARLRAAAEMETPAAIEGRVTAAAGPIAGRGAANRQTDKISARAHLDLVVAQWAAVRRTMGEDDRVIHRRLYLATGMSLLEMQAQDRQTMERFASVVEGWYS